MKFYDIDLQHLLKVTMFGKNTISSPYHHVTRIIHGVIIYIIESGSLTLKQNDEIVKLDRGDVYLFENGEHQVPLACENCTYYFVHFEQEHVTPLEVNDQEFRRRALDNHREFANAEIYSSSPYESIHAILPKRLHIDDPSSFEKITFPFKEYALTYEYNTPEYRIQLSAITAKFLMDLEEITCRMTEGGHRGKIGTAYETAREILRFVEMHYAENFTAEDISGKFFLNYDYANRIFKRHFGQSIISHRNRLRIHASKALLLDKSVVNTAALVGFTNPYYFTRCFMKYEGISPVEYRKKVRGYDNEDED